MNLIAKEQDIEVYDNWGLDMKYICWTVGPYNAAACGL